MGGCFSTTSLGSKSMFVERWKSSEEVPDFDGILSASGDAYKFHGTGIIKCAEVSVPSSWLDVLVLASLDLYGGKYRVECGECAQHGSIGVIVFENIVSGDAIWSLVSEDSNPFDQIQEIAGYVLVLSTSGAVFRFRTELQDVTLSIP
jgi:hypothetical protein